MMIKLSIQKHITNKQGTVDRIYNLSMACKKSHGADNDVCFKPPLQVKLEGQIFGGFSYFCRCNYSSDGRLQRFIQKHTSSGSHFAVYSGTSWPSHQSPFDLEEI